MKSYKHYIAREILRETEKELKSEIYSAKHNIERVYGRDGNWSLYFDMKFKDLKLDTRTRNCFENAGINSMRAIDHLAKYGFKVIPGLGPKSINELEYQLLQKIIKDEDDKKYKGYYTFIGGKLEYKHKEA